LDQRILKEDYFDRTICFEDLLSKRWFETTRKPKKRLLYFTLLSIL